MIRRRGLGEISAIWIDRPMYYKPKFIILLSYAYLARVITSI